MPARKNRNETDVNDNKAPSRSAKKRESAALQKLGEDLASLSPAARAEMDLPSDLREALELFDRITDREGVRRQKQFIGKLMRQVDASDIERQLRQLEALKGQRLQKFKQAEKLREDILAADDEDCRILLDRLLENRQSGINVQQWLELTARARQEQKEGAPKGAGRELFRELTRFLEAGE